MHQQMMNRMLSRNWLNNANYLTNEKYYFEVLLKDGTKQVVKSKIHTDTIIHKSYLEYVNKSVSRSDSNRILKIYPYQTLKISRVEIPVAATRFDPKPSYKIEGLAVDSCWRFKIISGKINAYSFLSEQSDLNTFYLNAFQYKNEEIQSLDPEKLRIIIQSNEKAVKAFNKKDYYNAILKYNNSN